MPIDFRSQSKKGQTHIRQNKAPKEHQHELPSWPLQAYLMYMKLLFDWLQFLSLVWTKQHSF